MERSSRRDFNRLQYDAAGPAPRSISRPARSTDEMKSAKERRGTGHAESRRWARHLLITPLLLDAYRHAFLLLILRGCCVITSNGPTEVERHLIGLYISRSLRSFSLSRTASTLSSLLWCCDIFASGFLLPCILANDNPLHHHHHHYYRCAPPLCTLLWTF